MRRSAVAFGVVGLMVLSTAAFAVTEWDSYRDGWSSVSYAGSDGSIHWERPWSEIGENDGPAAGAVHVDPDNRCADYKCLHIWGQGQQFSQIGVVRSADLSVFQDAELCYYITRAADEALKGVADADLFIQVSADGATWKTIDSYGLEAVDSEPIHPSKNLNNYLTETFAVRFVVSGVLGSEVFIDDIEIKGTTKPSASTTTTTIKPTTTTTIKTSTTSTVKATTTTTQSATTTTEPKPTTTSTPGDAMPETHRGEFDTNGRDSGAANQTTTTTHPETTTTTESVFAVLPAIPPPGGGIRETGSGIMTDYDSGMFGSVDMGATEVLGVELSPNYQMAVEVIESSWVWMLGLALIITATLLAGLDRRRSHRAVSQT
jgi:hypothetical protein